jgi:hypothetical protein
MADLPKWAEEKFKAYNIAEVKWHDKWHQGENYKDPEA